MWSVDLRVLCGSAVLSRLCCANRIEVRVGHSLLCCETFLFHH